MDIGEGAKSRDPGAGGSFLSEANADFLSDRSLSSVYWIRVVLDVFQRRKSGEISVDIG
jgi:hypothetical protein